MVPIVANSNLHLLPVITALRILYIKITLMATHSMQFYTGGPLWKMDIEPPNQPQNYAY